MKFIESYNTNPAFNLALEQYVFDCMPKKESYFMLWQNGKSIIVGKHQNTMEEINLPYVRAHDIQVVRRLSGGGAVYHDLGNVNFTFITDAGNLEELNLQAFCMPVVKTLEKIGIHAEVSGRNDITIDGKKFSGNSQYIKGGRVMHHGTLMFDSDLSSVAQALQVSSDKYESKGFKSVKSRVTNIREHLVSDLNLEDFKQLLREHMMEGAQAESYELTGSDYEKINRIQKERYDTWEWNFAFSPEYSVRKKRKIDGVGTIELFLQVEDGRIRRLDSRGDYFGDGVTFELQNCLQGCLLKVPELMACLQGFPVSVCFANLTVAQLVALLAE